MRPATNPTTPGASSASNRHRPSASLPSAALHSRRGDVDRFGLHALLDLAAFVVERREHCGKPGGFGHRHH
jgi:hypothetical protein